MVAKRNEILANVRRAVREPFTSLGGYPVYVYISDGEMLCAECVRENYRAISEATRHRLNDGWRAEGTDVYWEGPPQHCAHCNKALPSAYGDPETAERVRELDDFTRAYIDCALWSSHVGSDYASENDCAEDTSLESAGFSADELAPSTLDEIIEECASFQARNIATLARAGNDEQNGHDYWLTRNHHGAGFWDRGYPSRIGDMLMRAAHADGSRDLYVGDDGLIYQE